MLQKKVRSTDVLLYNLVAITNMTLINGSSNSKLRKIGISDHL